MKIVDNPRRDINAPAIEGLRLAGLGGVRRSGPAEPTLLSSSRDS